MRRAAAIRWAIALALGAAALATPALSAASGAAAPDGTGLTALLRQASAEYLPADRVHDAAGAARVRALAAAADARFHGDATRRLVSLLDATRERLRPWPLPQQISGLVASALRELRAAGIKPRPGADPYDEVAGLLDERAYAEAYAVFALGPGRRLQSVDPGIAATTLDDLWHGRLDAAKGDLRTVSQVLGDTKVSRATVVVNAGLIVFREGLEAVLILAAITASFVGARRRLRRPVLLGALLGLVATAITYVLAQTLIDALGDGGLRLQAITGLLAIAVLLVVTNWFFHRMYWSEWISRFNRRRKALERIDRLGFISGQTVGFVILGITSVYREGFETVLFLQNLQVSAGTSATLLGVAIGLGATFAVGLVTFAVERKLPYKRMLIATGVLIGLVLAIMVGITVHNLQGLGWLPDTSTGFVVDPRVSQWIGLYATWEGIVAQVASLLVVYGSYAVARQIQLRRRRRAIAGTALSPSG